MRSITRALALGCAVLALAACSHKDKNAPLAYVPANTPYLVANLKPLDDDAQTAALSMANAQLPAQVTQLQQAADKLDAEQKPHLAGLMRAFAHELDGHTYQQMAAADGIDMQGHTAIFGLGLSPVMRAELTDPAKFNAFIGRLEKGYGQPLAKGNLGKVSYRHLDLEKSGLQWIVSVQDKQFVVALLPTNDDALLRQALGVDRPEHSAQDSERLQKLAKDRGYGPYSVGYLDISALPALLTDGKDPIVNMFMKDAAQKAGATSQPAPTIPASCKPELTRIAARMPMLSFGYTKLDAKHMDLRVELDLADDIVKTFAAIKAPVPGLGTKLDAPFDLALALPMPTIREFWTAQADAVAAKPFTCPALTDLNKSFASLRQMLPKSAMPPIGDLRGLRLSLDKLASAAGGSGTPSVQGRVLVASSNPTGMLAIAQAAVPALSSIHLTDDGKPAALPAQLTAMTHQPVWAAMNKQALAVGVGPGQDAKLPPMLGAADGNAGQLMGMHLDGAMYAQWLQQMGDMVEKMTAADANTSERVQAQESAKASMAAAHAAAEKVAQMSADAHLGEHGLVINSSVELR